MPENEEAAEFSLSDAREIAQMVREWKAFKAAFGVNVDRGPPANDGIPSLLGPLGWILPTAGVPLDGDGDYRWKYQCTVYTLPFSQLITGEPKIGNASDYPGFNTLETKNTAGSMRGYPIVPEESADCADVYGIRPAWENIKSPILAQLVWTYFESNDPLDGYWAWWFTYPNDLLIKGLDVE